MYDDSVHSGLTTVSQFVPSIFLSDVRVVWNGFADPELDGVGLAGFKMRANAFLLA